MLSILDRYILRSLLFNYVIALAVMISLYVALDMFVNMDEFTEQGYPPLTVIRNMADYYTPNIFLYFAQLSGAITLFACLAAVARTRRQNELTAILSSGVSLYRVAAPVVAFGLATTALLVIDTEWLIPSVAHRIARDHDDADGSQALEVLFLRDRDDRLLSARRFHPLERHLEFLLVLARDENGAIVKSIEADRATWEPSHAMRPQGRWHLERGKETIRTFDDDALLGPRESITHEYPSYYESNLSPEDIQMRQAEGWINFLSLARLEELENSGVADRKAIARTRHARIAAPIVNMVLLLLGLPFFLDRSPSNVTADSGKCMLVCGVCYVVSFFGQNVRPESASALPAWIPIFIFATIAIVLIDRIRT